MRTCLFPIMREYMSSVFRIFFHPFKVSASIQLNVSFERVEAYRSGVMSSMSSKIKVSMLTSIA